MVSGDKCTILIVDDEKADLVVLNKILHTEYSILTAKYGEIAIKLAADEHPDLILLDILLPDMSGYDVLLKLKGNAETGNIPIIFITGLDSEEDEEKGFFLGAADYIKKPFKDSLVKARVRSHMEILAHMRAIKRLGLTDPLTGMPNRRNFDDRMSIEWRRAIREKKPISLLIMDIDNFKAYNDTYGHLQGDSLLIAVAQVLLRSVKRPADISARIGGEEFVMLLPDTGYGPARAIAEGIRSNVETLRVPTADDTAITCATISIGVASIVPEEQDTATVFMAKTDEYLYAAKTQGRNRVYPGNK